MSKQHLSKKHAGQRSKKAARVASAKARQQAYEALSPAEQRAQKDANKARYDAAKK